MATIRGCEVAYHLQRHMHSCKLPLGFLFAKTSLSDSKHCPLHPFLFILYGRALRLCTGAILRGKEELVRWAAVPMFVMRAIIREQLKSSQKLMANEKTSAFSLYGSRRNTWEGRNCREIWKKGSTKVILSHAGMHPPPHHVNLPQKSDG